MKKKCEINCWHQHTKTGSFYTLSFIGAAIYFISKATGFWGVVLAILKAMVWPAYLIYGLLKFLGI